LTIDPNGAPPVYEIVFDPHVAVAVSILAIALVILALLIAVPIPADRQARRRK
jgi:hypothetical protein